MRIEEEVSAEVDNILRAGSCIILHIIPKPNTIIVLSFNQNIFKFLTSLPPRRLSSKPWPFFRHSFSIETHFFSCRYSSKSRQHPSSNIFWVFLLSFRSVSVRNLAISSSDSRERQFFLVYS